MKTSAEGIAFLERHEGVVLKAYLCPAGHWTIGAGLTKATGIITPKAGMKITRQEASALLAQALSGNYEPGVARQMPGANQHEFDGGVSFHFNTGQIAKASWVKAWLDGDWGEVKRRIKLWKKGGGRVLPGLVRRREEEFDLIAHASYGKEVSQRVEPRLARITLPLTQDEIGTLRKELKLLGYDPGDNVLGVAAGAAGAFQLDHGLTVDGIIGRATLSTLQRRIDARAKVKTNTAVAGTGAGAAGTAGATDTIPVDQAISAMALVAGWGLLLALYLAWSYRDVIAAKMAHRFPNLARKLRGH
ncbi:lysozyme [Roseobacter sp. OBYS 0001]|uniref:lysozyme n=1 Tax=Roseobacter sp. OBYS 0001 TaxID=882651 RepID=UPI001C8279CB|nr:glycoside hydrolase family protein [Roseobacter sp. OBYS 0001]